MQTVGLAMFAWSPDVQHHRAEPEDGQRDKLRLLFTSNPELTVRIAATGWAQINGPVAAKAHLGCLAASGNVNLGRASLGSRAVL